MLPILPNLPTETSICCGNGLSDKIAAVIGGLVNADDVITIKEIELVEKRLSQFFRTDGSEQLESGVKVLYHILNPPEDKAQAIIDMCKAFDEKGVIDRAKEELLWAFADIIEEGRQIDSNGLLLLEILFDKLNIKNRELEQRINEMQNISSISVDLESRRSSQTGLFEIASKWVKTDRKSTIDPLTSSSTRLNSELFNVLSTIQQLAWAMDDTLLMKRVQSFVSQIKSHPFKIVICGEIKNGKSSIFNAILGQEASFVKGSFPTTGAIFKLQYSKRPDFIGHWMNSNQSDRLESSLKKLENGVIEKDLLEKIQDIKTSEVYKPGEEIINIRSTDDLEDYISTQGRYSDLVREVTFTSNIPLLKNGALLVDTPGLNDSILIRNEISIEESLTADCVIFTMNAEALKKATDEIYLKELFGSGRTVNIILVVTRIDRIETEEEREKVLTQAEDWVKSVVEHSPNIRILGPIGLNAKLAMELSIEKKYKAEPDKSGLSQLISCIQDVLSDDTNNKRYRENSQQQFNKLKDFTKARCKEFFDKVNQQMPSSMVLNVLDKNRKTIALISEELIKSVQARLDVINRDCRTFMQSFGDQVEAAKNAAVLDLSNEIRTKVEILGEMSFANDKHWEEFDNKYVPKIAERHFSKLQEQFEKKIDDWKEALESFNSDNKDAISRKIPLLIDGAEDLSKVCSQNNRLIHVSSVINRSIRDGEKFAAGLLGGHMLTGGTAAVASVGISVVGTIGLPVTISAVGLMAIGYAALRKITAIQKNKEKFISRKVDNFKSALDKKATTISMDLRSTEKEIRSIFLESAEKQYTPIIKQSIMLAQYNKLYLDAIKASQDSADKFHGKIEEQFSQIKAINV